MAVIAKPNTARAAGRSGKAQTERAWLASVPSLYQLSRKLMSATSNSDAVPQGCPGTIRSWHGLLLLMDLCWKMDFLEKLTKLSVF